MGKGKRIKTNRNNGVSVSITSGDAAQDSFQALLGRMQANPENFMVGSSDMEIFGTGYMCTGCAMPAPGPGRSSCCDAPVIAVDLD
jgi:hypothetical protein